MTITFHDWDRDPAVTNFHRGDELSGKVTFSAEEDAEWVGFAVELSANLTGALQPRSIVLQTTVLQGLISLRNGEQRTYDFSISLDKIFSYDGQNAVVTPRLTAFARPPDTSGNQLHRSRKKWTTAEQDLRITAGASLAVDKLSVQLRR